jgi:hypothetical protein
MSEAVELPEAKDPYERRVAITIAAIAVGLALISVMGSNAKTEGLLAATRASNQWAYFQAKSIKEHNVGAQRELLGMLTGVDEAKRAEKIKSHTAQLAAYEKEKEAIKVKAEKLEEEVERNTRIDERCDLAELLLQVAIVLGSVAILVHWKLFWFLAIALGASGAGAGITAFLMRMHH